MNIPSRVICALLLLTFSGLGAKESKESHEKAMLQDIEGIRNAFSVRYAPVKLKKKLFGWDIDSAFDRARQKVIREKPKNVKAFQRIVQSVFLSAKDYHTQVSFYSTAQAFIPLSIRGASGRYFVIPWNGQDCDCEYHLEDSDSKIRLEDWVGSEMIAIDDVPIADAIEDIIDNELGGDRSPTGYAIAERLVFQRRGEFGQQVPGADCELVLRSKENGSMTRYLVPWIHAPEEIKDQMKGSGKFKLSRAIAGRESHATALDLLKQDYSVPFVSGLVARGHVKRMATMEEDEKEDGRSGDEWDIREKSFLPPLGRILWETARNDYLYAYLYENSAGHRIGYLCIPSFKQGEDDANNFVSTIQDFERESDALVIDVTDNPGGWLFFMYSVLAMLTDVPLNTLSTQQIITQEDVYSAIQLANLCSDPIMSQEILPQVLFGYPLSHAVRMDMKNFANRIIKCWNSGYRMTRQGVGEIKAILPHPDVQYTKPILVLVNEMAFSCGDLFPALLQDNQRAVIFGKQTAGAGGAVRFYPHASRMGIAGFSLTTSLVYRLDGTPIENQGVSPDIPYEITVRDLQEDYADYIETVNSVIERMVPPVREELVEEPDEEPDEAPVEELFCAENIPPYADQLGNDDRNKELTEHRFHCQENEMSTKSCFQHYENRLM